MEGPESWTAVGATALGVARVRAEESRRPDRLFDDPYAEAFIVAAPDVFAEEQSAARCGPLASMGAVFSAQAVLRTRFFDDYLLSACEAGCTQVVLLAAGLDSRAFRLAWPSGVRLFELDLPDVLAFKEAVLTMRGAVARCARTIVPADLRGDWPSLLVDVGFTRDERTAWLAEGLLIYLSAEEAEGLLTAVGEWSGPGGQLAFELSDPDGWLADQASAMPAMDRFTSLWKGGLGDDAPGWLMRHGWQVRTHDVAVVAASYGRFAPDRVGGGFLTAARAASSVVEARIRANLH